MARTTDSRSRSCRKTAPPEAWSRTSRPASTAEPRCRSMSSASSPSERASSPLSRGPPISAARRTTERGTSSSSSSRSRVWASTVAGTRSGPSVNRHSPRSTERSPLRRRSSSTSSTNNGKPPAVATRSSSAAGRAAGSAPSLAATRVATDSRPSGLRVTPRTRRPSIRWRSAGHRAPSGRAVRTTITPSAGARSTHHSSAAHDSSSHQCTSSIPSTGRRGTGNVDHSRSSASATSTGCTAGAEVRGRPPLVSRLSAAAYGPSADPLGSAPRATSPAAILPSGPQAAAVDGANRTTNPSLPAAWRSSADLPIPASPTSAMTCPWPLRVCSMACARAATSSSRPARAQVGPSFPTSAAMASR